MLSVVHKDLRDVLGAIDVKVLDDLCMTQPAAFLLVFGRHQDRHSMALLL